MVYVEELKEEYRQAEKPQDGLAEEDEYTELMNRVKATTMKSERKLNSK